MRQSCSIKLCFERAIKCQLHHTGVPSACNAAAAIKQRPNFYMKCRKYMGGEKKQVSSGYQEDMAWFERYRSYFKYHKVPKLLIKADYYKGVSANSNKV